MLEALPTLASYLDPRPQSWFHGQEGQWLKPSLGAARESSVMNGKRHPLS